MTPTLNASPTPSGLRKAAVFLMGVGDQMSAELLRHLAPGEVRLITNEIAATNSVPSAQMLSVFREFESRTAEVRYFAKGGTECARRLLQTAFGPESAEKLLADTASDAKQAKPGATGVLEKSDPQQLASFLKTEHPQTIAVVLSSISGEAAGGLIQSLPPETQAQVALRMACLDRVAPEAFQKIAESIGSKLKDVRQINKTDGSKTLAAMLNHVDGDKAEAILEAIAEQNPAVADSVRALMFIFEDILKIDKQGMTVLTGKIDRKLLTTALKGCAPNIRSHFTGCMSQRNAEMLVEDMEALGPVRIRDVENAQKEVLAAVRQLQQAGTISVARGGGDDYVV